MLLPITHEIHDGDTVIGFASEVYPGVFARSDGQVVTAWRIGDARPFQGSATFVAPGPTLANVLALATSGHLDAQVALMQQGADAELPDPLPAQTKFHGPVRPQE